MDFGSVPAPHVHVGMDACPPPTFDAGVPPFASGAPSFDAGLPFIAGMAFADQAGPPTWRAARPYRRSGPRNPIQLAISVLVTAVVVVIGIVVLLAHESGCRGGIDQLNPPTYVSADNANWTATYSCVGGGTKSIPVPAGQFPNVGG